MILRNSIWNLFGRLIPLMVALYSIPIFFDIFGKDGFGVILLLWSIVGVFVFDVIEHLEKGVGKRLLEKTEAIAKKQVVYFTPIGFMPQDVHEDGKDAWGMDGAGQQCHKSGWFPQDFGQEYNFIMCENFHLTNNLGVKLDDPYGAFIAFKNLNNNYKGIKIPKVVFLHRIVDLCYRIFSKFINLLNR